MVNFCCCFDYSPEEGAKCFAVCEFFMSFFNLIEFCHLCHYLHWTSSHEITGHWVFMFIFAVSMLVQVICGFILYFIGVKSKNQILCWVWVVAALINFLIGYGLWCFVLFGSGANYSYGYIWFDYHSRYWIYALYGAIVIIIFLVG